MSETVGRSDFLVIGGGIAGASAAAGLAQAGRTVVLLEREAQPGYHTTGRSAALFTETYGPPAIRALTTASRAFLTEPPDGFSDHPLLGPRGALLVGRADQAASIEAAFAEGADRVDGLVRLDGAGRRAAGAWCLREGYAARRACERARAPMEAKDRGPMRPAPGLSQAAGRSAGGLVLTDCGAGFLGRRCAARPASCSSRCASATGDTSGIAAGRWSTRFAGAWAEEVRGPAGAAPDRPEVPKRRKPSSRRSRVAGGRAEINPPTRSSDSARCWFDLWHEETSNMKPESGRLTRPRRQARRNTVTPPAAIAQPGTNTTARASGALGSSSATTLEIRPRMPTAWAGQCAAFVTRQERPWWVRKRGFPRFCH